MDTDPDSETRAGARDRMRPFGDLCSFEAALETTRSICRPISESERLPLEDARDRVLSRPVDAPADVPSSDRAAMDGYAVRAEDLTAEAPVQLRCAGAVLAGEVWEGTVEAGTCIEVATGAPLPDGADTVVPVEETERHGDEIRIEASRAAGDNVAVRGEDLQADERLAEVDQRLTPPRVAAVAAVGIDRVEVWRRPRVLLVPTGDEVVEPGEPLDPGQVYDSNSVAARALLAGAGADVERSGVIGDDPKGLQAALERAEFDLVVTLGGTSVGRHDLVLEVVQRVGRVLVHGIAVKPGKPLLVADIDGRPMVGLPGFPTSSLMLAYTFLEPLVRGMGHLPGDGRPRRRARLSREVESPADKHQFLTVELRDGEALPAYRASSTITSMSRADGWIEIPVGTARVRPGVDVEVKLF